MTVPAWLQDEWGADLAARQAGDWDEVERLARENSGHRGHGMTWWPHRPTSAPYWTTVARCCEDEARLGLSWPISADHTTRAQYEQLARPRVPL